MSDQLLPPCAVEADGYEPGAAYCPECRRVHVGQSLAHALDTSERGAAWRKLQRGEILARYGPGTELEKMLAAAELQIKLCDCPAKVRQMNLWGVPGCQARRGTIIGWLAGSCAKLAAERGVDLEISVTELRAAIGEQVDEAIRRADEKQRTLPKQGERRREPRPKREPKLAKACADCGGAT